MKIFRNLITLSLLTWLAGCGHDPGYRLSDFNFPQYTEVQVVNLMPDSPSTLATVSPNPPSSFEQPRSGVADFASATPQQSFVVGTYDIKVTYLDADGLAHDILNQTSQTFLDKDQWVYLFTGSVTNPTVQKVNFTDPFFTGGISSDDVMVWFANGASAPDQVDIYLTNATTPIAAVSPTTTLTTGAYSDPVTLTNRPDWRLRVTPAGSTTILFDSGSFTMNGGDRTLLALTDYFGPKGVGASSTQTLLDGVKITSAGAQKFASGNLPSELRIINLVRDLGPLDVYFGSTSGAPFAGNLAQLGTTPYQDITPGADALNVTETGIKDQFVLEQDLSFGSGAFYTLVLTGSYNGGGTNSTLNSVLFTTDARPIQGRTKVNFINAGSVNKSVNVYLLAPGQALTDTSPQLDAVTPDTLKSLTLRSGETDVVVTSSDNKNIILGPTRYIFNEGTTYTLVMVEDPVNQATQAKLMVLADTP